MPHLPQPIQDFVHEFGLLIIQREFEAAHAFLSSGLAQDVTVGNLEEDFDEMIVHFDTEDVGIAYQSIRAIDEDVFGLWVYATVEGDGEVEAITVAVKEDGDSYKITEIEWGEDQEEPDPLGIPW